LVCFFILDDLVKWFESSLSSGRRLLFTENRGCVSILFLQFFWFHRECRRRFDAPACAEPRSVRNAVIHLSSRKPVLRDLPNRHGSLLARTRRRHGMQVSLSAPV
jgi:hypothetical protein